MKRKLLISFGAVAAAAIWAMPASAQSNPGQPNDPARAGSVRVQPGTTGKSAEGGASGGLAGGQVGDTKPPKLDAGRVMASDYLTPGSASTTDGSDRPIGGALGGTIGGGGPKQAEIAAGAAAAGPGGGPTTSVGTQQASRLGVGGAAGEAGECCKPKELNAASMSAVSIQQGTRSASAGGAAGNAGECCKPKERNPASMADGSVRSAPAPAQNARRQPDPHP